ncbi:MAG: AI-2E family transporter [Acetobacteraceae bacterium]|nr:AI-2E family transporter [Acetobacteraceae bacterium]
MRMEANRFQQITRTVLAIVLLALGVWTLREFLPALIWAAILAIAVWPYYQRVQRRVFYGGRSKLALPLTFTLAIALLFLIPLGLVALQVAREAHSFMDLIESARKDGIPPPAWLASLPFGATQATEWWNQNLADPASASELLRRAGHGNYLLTGREVGSQIIHRIVLFGFTLLTLFFLFRDGEQLIDQMRRGSERAFGPSGERVGEQMVASVHGTVDGLVLVGLGEGFVLGIAYVIAGVSHPATFGFFTAVAAMIPFGAPLLFGIASLLLLVQGAVVAAIAVFIWGVIVTFVADHFVRPALIGGATRLPFLWVLLGILGGVAAWGLVGLFLGPAIMAALILLWREWTGNASTPPDATSRPAGL